MFMVNKSDNHFSKPKSFSDVSAEQSLEVIRNEIKAFLDMEKHGPTAKVIKLISKVYENSLTLRDYEIKRLVEQGIKSSQRDSLRDDSKFQQFLTVFSEQRRGKQHEYIKLRFKNWQENQSPEVLQHWIR